MIRTFKDLYKLLDGGVSFPDKKRPRGRAFKVKDKTVDAVKKMKEKLKEE